MIPRQEKFSDVAADATMLFCAHWLEMYGSPAGFRPDIAGLADDRNFAYFTLRTPEGKLAGHFGLQIFRQPLYGMLIAQDLFYYLVPEHRGGFGICALLRFAANAMHGAGVGRIAVSHKSDVNLGPILARAGFVKSGEMYFWKDTP